MNRRHFSLACLGLAAAASVGVAPAAATPKSAERESGKPHIAFLLFDGLTAQDMIGPATVLGASGQFTMDYVWRDTNPVRAESRSPAELHIVPTATFAETDSADILCVPGTSNVFAQLRQPDILDWVARVGATATWVTSVCTGSFILGAAGLLQGYKATSHWTLVDELAAFGAIPTRERVVADRNRLTGAGVTSGIDFGLTLLAKLCGDDAAKTVQLTLEYDPEPPFACGSPKSAPAELTAKAKAGYLAYLEQVAPDARQLLDAASKRLGVKGL